MLGNFLGYIADYIPANTVAALLLRMRGTSGESWGRADETLSMLILWSC